MVLNINCGNLIQSKNEKTMISTNWEGYISIYEKNFNPIICNISKKIKQSLNQKVNGKPKKDIDIIKYHRIEL